MVLATLVSLEGVSQGALEAARDALAALGARLEPPVWFDPPAALDLPFAGAAPAAARRALEAALPGLDVIVQPRGPHRLKRLLVADMDSTIIGQECIDELADFAGCRAEIAAITEAAMQGELDFAGALRARVRALAGLPVAAIEATLAERVRLNPGARTLVATMKARGARTLLVSGGFTAFTAAVAARAGFDAHVANRLGMAGGRLDGTVAEPIVDAAAKRNTLLAERTALGLPPSATLALGDGANDIPMLGEAGLGLAYHAKPRAAAAADAAIRVGDLRVALAAQGIPRRDWVAGA
ncbi:phosphoserine phosphatase SerB [Thermaurantiacus sp.]